VTIRIVFETHSTSEDNENGIATGWLPGLLSELGREQAADLGVRRRADGIAAVFSSDLARSAETAGIAFRGSAIPVLLDWRLRECDYGQLNGSPAAELHVHRAEFVDTPYPGGESWRQAAERMASFVADLPLRWSGQRVLVIGHVATRWGLEHLLLGTPLEDLAISDFDWQPGWEYTAG
jgi:alpha-ribazole phosphatase/probable phosphoglycerate mutase